jgi:hypothetical protein
MPKGDNIFQMNIKIPIGTNIFLSMVIQNIPKLRFWYAIYTYHQAGNPEFNPTQV